MKKLLNFLFAIVACYTMVSCYVPYTISTTDDWKKLHIGASYNQIVTTYGAPHRQQPDGKGGTILIYEHTQSSSQSVATKSNVINNYRTGTQYYTPGVRTEYYNHTYYDQFYIDANDRCYLVNTNVNHSRTGKKYDRKVTILLSTVFGTFAAMLPLIIWSFTLE